MDEPLLATDISRNTSEISIEEKAQILATRVIHSQGLAMPVFYLSLLAASIAEIVWIMHPWAVEGCCRISYPTSTTAFLVEGYLTLGLLSETLLRMAWLRASFWAAQGSRRTRRRNRREKRLTRCDR